MTGYQSNATVVVAAEMIVVAVSWPNGDVDEVKKRQSSSVRSSLSGCLKFGIIEKIISVNYNFRNTA